MAYGLWKRQAGNLDGISNGNGSDDGGGEYNFNDDDVNWWWTPAGMATRYAIVAVLLGAVLLFFVGGYYHTQRRLRRGQAPNPMFRWLVRRPYYPPPHPRYPHYQDPDHQGFQMEAYAPPPPMYNAADGPPPVYQPPQGASKAMADQNFRGTNRAEGEGSGSADVTEPPPATTR